MITLDRLSKGGLMDKAPEKKICKDCGKEKKLSKFKKSSKMRDNHENRCLICYSKRNKELRQIKLQKAQEFFDPKTPAF
jgi:hypothetical protein